MTACKLEDQKSSNSFFEANKLKRETNTICMGCQLRIELDTYVRAKHGDRMCSLRLRDKGLVYIKARGLLR